MRHRETQNATHSAKIQPLLSLILFSLDHSGARHLIINSRVKETYSLSTCCRKKLHTAYILYYGSQFLKQIMIKPSTTSGAQT